MSNIAINIENLWKEYRLGVAGHGWLFRDLQSWYARMRGKEDPNTKISWDYSTNVHFGDRFWALQNINAEIYDGEIIGIIGKNGAGKSTLLKIISKVTSPTKGVIKLRGRIASLLEVGTGFHPELTGRENVYLNGTILGMTKSEIIKKFDEIVEFSGIERFIDTPVKRYSSGMYVRLAFAVAAHLEPEILVVDEVLAVGDLQFQKKCIGKMKNVSKTGRTVLFVSHNMTAIKQLCEKCLLLEEGRIVFSGISSEVVAKYEKETRVTNSETAGLFVRNPDDIKGKQVWVSNAEIRDEFGKRNVNFSYGDRLELLIEIGGKPPQDDFTVEWVLYNEKTEVVSYGGSFSNQLVTFNRNNKLVRCILGPLYLTTGLFQFAIALRVWNQAHWDFWSEAVWFQINHCDPNNTGFSVNSANWGSVYIQQKWESI